MRFSFLKVVLDSPINKYSIMYLEIVTLKVCVALFLLEFHSNMYFHRSQSLPGMNLSSVKKVRKLSS